MVISGCETVPMTLFSLEIKNTDRSQAREAEAEPAGLASQHPAHSELSVPCLHKVNDFLKDGNNVRGQPLPHALKSAQNPSWHAENVIYLKLVSGLNSIVCTKKYSLVIQHWVIQTKTW